MSAALQNGMMSVPEPALHGLVAELQNTLVPPLSHRRTNLEAYGRSHPKDGVGGDLMDLVADGNGVVAYVGDVSGHGLRAGVLMGMMKTAMRYGLLLQRPLRSLVADLNRLLPQVKTAGMYATLAALSFDGSGEAEFVSAGHVPMLQFRQKNKDVVRYYALQPPLGLLAGDADASAKIPVAPGDIFLLLSDGAVELGEELDSESGLETLAQMLADFHERPLAEILEELEARIGVQGTQHDDRTLLLVRVNDERAGQIECETHARVGGDLLEAMWQKMLTDLAAGLADD